MKPAGDQGIEPAHLVGKSRRSGCLLVSHRWRRSEPGRLAARSQRRERVTDWPLIGQHRGKAATVTYTLGHPLVADLFTVARSRLHEVINDRMESLTELQTDFADQ